MNRNLAKTAQQLQCWLADQGCQIQRTSRIGQTPILSLAGPFPECLTHRVIWGLEWRKGATTPVALIRYGGCLIQWRP
ncbi:hypothetical protein [Aeromonas sp. R9-1]|uniref:hypothetical protein n=1 Tax=Aeromonas sp. R9-1 TaxID=3138478 RepID=UPI0034A45279